MSIRSAGGIVLIKPRAQANKPTENNNTTNINASNGDLNKNQMNSNNQTAITSNPTQSPPASLSASAAAPVSDSSMLNNNLSASNNKNFSSMDSDPPLRASFESPESADQLNSSFEHNPAIAVIQPASNSSAASAAHRNSEPPEFKSPSPSSAPVTGGNIRIDLSVIDSTPHDNRVTSQSVTTKPRANTTTTNINSARGSPQNKGPPTEMERLTRELVEIHNSTSSRQQNADMPGSTRQDSKQRKSFLVNTLSIYLLVFSCLEVLYIIIPNYSITNNWPALLIRIVVSIILLIYVLIFRYTTLFQRIHIPIESTTALLITCSLIALIVCEIFRDSSSNQFTTRDGLTLSLVVLCGFAFDVLKFSFRQSYISAIAVFGSFNGILFGTNTYTMEYILQCDSYLLLIFLLLLWTCRDDEFSRHEDIITKQYLVGERIKAEKLLQSMLPPQILSQFLDGSVLPISGIATIGFCYLDFGGSQANNQLNPSEVMQRLHDTFKRIDGIVNVYSIRGVNKIETVSKTYLLCAGLLTDDVDDHCAAMIDVCLEIMNMINGRSQGNQRIPLSLRCGIATGSVVGGVIGTSRRFFRVFGDTVNVASRMCANAKTGQIQMTEVSYNSLTNRQRTQYKIPSPIVINIKGKGEMLCYQLSPKDNWVPQFSKSLMSRGMEHNTKLLEKSFIYHKLISATELNRTQLNYTSKRGELVENELENQFQSEYYGQFIGSIRILMILITLYSIGITIFSLLRLKYSLAIFDPIILSIWCLISFIFTFSLFLSQFRIDPNDPIHQQQMAAAAGSPPSRKRTLKSHASSSASADESDPLQAASSSSNGGGNSASTGNSASSSPNPDSQQKSEILDPSVPDSRSKSLQHLLSYYCMCLTIVVVILQSNWGFRGPVSPHYIMLTTVLLSALLFRLQFKYAFPLVIIQIIAYFIVQLVTYESYYDILYIMTLLLLIGICGLSMSYSFERSQRLNFLLKFAMLQEQHHMDAFLHNLLPPFIVKILKKNHIQDPFAAHRNRVGTFKSLAVKRFLAQGAAQNSNLNDNNPMNNSAASPTAAAVAAATTPASQNRTLPSKSITQKNTGSTQLAVLPDNNGTKSVSSSAPSSDMNLSVATIAVADTSMSISMVGSSSRFSMKLPSCTVFESDLVGYTSLASTWTAYQTLDFLHEIFNRFDEVARVNRVEKLETIGDAYMAVRFDGEPDPVLEFALQVIIELREVAEKTKQNFQIRSGICTGPAWGCILGSDVPRFHLFGPSHDTSIHIEQNGRPGEAIVSRSTYEMACDRYDFQALPELIVDGQDCFLLQRRKNKKLENLL